MSKQISPINEIIRKNKKINLLKMIIKIGFKNKIIRGRELESKNQIKGKRRLY
jgi:hypothetical protein